MATTCGHTHKPHYSNGLCQSCYLAQYYLKKKAKNQAKKASQESQKSKSEEYPEELNPKRQKTEEWLLINSNSINKPPYIEHIKIHI